MDVPFFMITENLREFEFVLLCCAFRQTSATCTFLPEVDRHLRWRILRLNLGWAAA